MKALAFAAFVAAVVLGSNRALASNVEVTVYCCGDTFQPSSVAIQPGDTVTWRLGDVVSSHRIASGLGGFDSTAGSLFDGGLTPTTGPLVHRFDELGTFHFFCRAHEGLDPNAVTPGTVLVRCTDLGNVNGSGSARQDALEINGSAGDGRQQVSAFVGQPIVLSLDSSNSGPVHANYAVWIWRAAVANTAPLRVGGSIVGCVYDPTPLTGGSPQPFTCVHSPAFGTFCAGLSVRASPPTTPWTLTRAQGFHVPLSFTLQAILEDDASDNPQHLSVSNVVILRVHM